MNNKIILATDTNYYINLSSDSKTYSWLIDTGATISALKHKYVLEHNIPVQKEDTVINGIGGKVHAIGYVYLTLASGDHRLNCNKFYVFETLPCRADGIIGQDFISKHKSVLDFSNDTFTLLTRNNFKIVLPLLRHNNKIEISPRCESIHYFQTNFTEECVVHSKEISDGIFLASSIAMPVNGLIPIKILNTTDKSYTLTDINPHIDKLSLYNICSFDKTKNDADRVKQLFSILNLKNLNKEEQISIENLCAKYSDIFYLPGDKLTTTNIYEHSISLKPNTTSVFTKPYRLPHAQKGEIKQQIDNMLNEGIIEPCSSEWSSPILLVPKKTDGTSKKKWRLVIDYRKLNNVIQDDKFPLPNITEVLDSLSGSIYFSHLDMYQSYYNISLEQHSRKYTAFCSGQYQMTRMPMGLKTSPGSFSRMITIAMSGLTHEKCLVYLDDLIVFGRNLSMHNKNLQDVFERLRKVNLKLNPQKCNFLKKELLYLGHVISGNGILPDPDKIRIVQNYPRPTNVDETRRFVAFVNYYRKFMPNFAELAYPLNKLCRKNASFVWDKKCQSAFEKLKEIILAPPVLEYPDFSEQNEFILQTDASNYAIGAILSNKNGRPVSFASRTLNKSEINYPTIDKELLAIVWAIKHFRPYLYGKHFKILTDHRPLISLFNMKDPSSRLFKFRLLLEEYDFTIDHVRGSENAAADALSRISITSNDLKHIHELSISVMTRAQKRNLNNSKVQTDASDTTTVWSDQPNELKTRNTLDESVELRFIDACRLETFRKMGIISKESNTFIYIPKEKTIYVKYLTSPSQISPAEFVRELKNFCKSINVTEIYLIKSNTNTIFIEKLLNEIDKIKKWSGPHLHIVKDVNRIENKDDKRVILNDFHLLPTSGHAGVRRMFNNIKKYYYWTGLENDIKEFIKRCDKCQKQKYSSNNIKQPMEITTTAHSAFEKIYIDLVGPLDRDNYNYAYILTLQCELTKYIEVYPLVTKKTEEVARALVNNFILRYGVPKVIATDRGTEFLSSTFKEVCKLLNIKQLNSAAYHHQSIGALENTHKHLNSFLRIQTDNHSESWSTWLPFWSFCYNTSVHSSTKYTPYELVFGKKCCLPSNLTNRVVDPLYNVDYYPFELKFRLQKSQKEARDNLLKSKFEQKKRYDKNINPVTYRPNDLVLIKNNMCNKLDNVYSGPYRVISDESPNVKILNNGKVDIIHKNRTKLYHSQ